MSGYPSQPTHNEQYAGSMIGVPKDAGAMLCANFAVMRPMPAMVILIHGVNDNGGAYQNLDQGLCAGLNTRLGRTDLFPHQWNTNLGQLQKGADGNIIGENSDNKGCFLSTIGRSPIIPFYWGYRPVDYQTYHQDQKRYKKELRTKKKEANLPYDSYLARPDIKKTDVQVGRRRDNLQNPLTHECAKGGGVFPNATTNIPDMFGPGDNSMMVTLASVKTHLDPNGYQKQINSNPSRIYLVHAAQRLADLILEVRKKYETDPINIVAHSQGTIITMLASLIVDAAGERAADCVIFNNSPYSLELTVLAPLLREGSLVTLLGEQTFEGREETLINFVNMMSDNKGTPLTEAELIAKGVLVKQEDGGSTWRDPLYARDNFGQVYNYFTPHDQVVSLWNIQGIGWQGVADETMAKLGSNFKQRIFVNGEEAGGAPKRFQFKTKYYPKGTMRPDDPNFTPYSEWPDQTPGITEIHTKKDYPEYYIRREIIDPYDNVSYEYDAYVGIREHNTGATSDNILTSKNFGDKEREINAEQVPEPFIFTTEGDIDLGAENERLYLQEEMAQTLVDVDEMIDLPTGFKFSNFHQTNNRFNAYDKYDVDDYRMYGVVLEAQHLQELQTYIQQSRPDIILKSAIYYGEQLLITRYQTSSELSPPKQEKSGQHSSIVNNPDASKKVMAFDLAIGVCRSYDDKEFWYSLLHRADWCDPKNPDKKAKLYYRTGVLPKEIKDAMNKPKDFLGKIPRVSNKFRHKINKTTLSALRLMPMMAEQLAINYSINEIRNHKDLQWPMPDPDLSDEI